MAEYFRPEVDAADTDATSIQSAMEARFVELFPGYVFNPADGLRYVFEAVALEAADTRLVATGEGQTFDQLARKFGERVYGVIPKDPNAATASSTWTVNHTNGFLIEAGTEVRIDGVDGEPVGFEVVENVTILPGGSTTAVGGVALIAVEPGAIANGAFSNAEPEETIPSIVSITLTAPASGGSDGETDEAYLARFALLRSIEKPALVKPADFEVWATLWNDFTYGTPVARAVARDMYNPADGTSNNVGMITVIPIGFQGQALSAPIKAALKANYEASLQTGAVVHVQDPNFTTVTITFSFTVYPGNDPATVKAAAESQLLQWLHPSNWGRGPAPEGIGQGIGATWYNEPAVRRDDVFEVLGAVPGLRHVTALIINGSASADLTLTITNANPVGLPNGTTSTAVGTAV